MYSDCTKTNLEQSQLPPNVNIASLSCMWTVSLLQATAQCVYYLGFWSILLMPATHAQETRNWYKSSCIRNLHECRSIAYTFKFPARNRTQYVARDTNRATWLAGELFWCKKLWWVGFNIVWVFYTSVRHSRLCWKYTDISTTHWTTQFHGAVSWVGCSLRAPCAGVANSQTDRHRAKVTVGAYMWACELPVVVLA